MSWRYPADILHRKLEYLRKLASADGINLSMDRWIATLQDIQLEISYETIYRLLLELYLMLNAGFDPQDFDFPIIEDDWNPWDIVIPIVEPTGKGHWDVTYWDKCYYDPPDIQFRDIERMAWDMRYAISDKDTLTYKKQSNALKRLLNAKEEGVVASGVSEHMPAVIQTTLAMVESRILNGFFVGFAIVGLSKVAKRHQIGYPYRAKVDTRHPDEWKDEHLTESVISWEAVVNWSRVGYFRVGAWYQLLNKHLSDKCVERINAFWMRTGFVSAGQLSQYGGIDYTSYGTPTYGGYMPQEVRTLYPRIFMLQRIDQYHYTGGKHQLKMQYNVKNIRKILDRHGVIGTDRMAYMSFGHEIKYFDYAGHKKYKRWKALLTADDIIQKYIKLGCDNNVLREIKGIVRP